MKCRSCPTLAVALAATAGLFLSACTSSQVLEPSALVGGAAPMTAETSPAGASAGAETVPAAISTDARIQFVPVVGAPEGASAPLAARLSARAAARGIALVGAGQSSASLIMKGYFSAISEDGQTMVIYVWDVVDAAGTRVHRIQGQTRAPASGGDGWDDVQPATMEAIADETVDRLATWLTTREG